MNNQSKDVYNNFYLPSLVIKKTDKKKSVKKLIDFLKKKDVSTRPFFRPLSSLPMFTSKVKKNPNAYFIHRNGINLPSYGNMKLSEVKYVSHLINNFFNT